MGSFNFYAIRQGRENGIVNSWDECADYTQGYSGAEYKGFDDKQRAKAWLNGGNCPTEKEQESSPNQLRYKLPPASNGMAELHIREGEDETAWFAVHGDEIVASGIEEDSLINGTDAMVEFIRKVALRLKAECRGRVVRRENGEITDEMREKVNPDSSDKNLAEEIKEAGADMCSEVTDAKPDDFPDGRWFAWYPRAFSGNIVGFLDGELYLIHHSGEQKRVEVNSREQAIELAAKHLRRDNEQADTGSDSLPDSACKKCGGTGYIPAYSHIAGGVCFRCGGSGKAPVHA